MYTLRQRIPKRFARKYFRGLAVQTLSVRYFIKSFPMYTLRQWIPKRFARKCFRGQPMESEMATFPQPSLLSGLYPSLQFFDVSNWCGKDSVLDIAPKEKMKRRNVWRAWRPGCWSIPSNPPIEMFRLGNHVLRGTPVWGCSILLKHYPWLKFF
ncbi:hypothetical protein AVEN_216345-1 [Araneus ventricosus]|uniref:Uncharacterized protein n=1 Tax=Araneus ventricosus TaxID=182803 RepID=A0A4Y2WTM0_ARAVE|nr:hypothetical protein AVEN_248315-1 [Araneus ventricosus]GBO40146.1 hypothetical protein AVEN_256764-1 [Araneus ventricosus]GBO40148.1 hypothetical protein AVEN_13195-1 [Araneus ventricosus]GBO40224.1 hypothetical protein AVEN_216345-1 [Araneus ventricosus]